MPIDNTLLEGEDADVLAEARNIAGEDWLHIENVRLGGVTPVDAIANGNEGLVRDVLRSIKCGMFS